MITSYIPPCLQRSARELELELAKTRWIQAVEYLKEEIENNKHDKRKVRALLQRLRDQYSWRPAIY